MKKFSTIMYLLSFIMYLRLITAHFFNDTIFTIWEYEKEADILLLLLSFMAGTLGFVLYWDEKTEKKD